MFEGVLETHKSKDAGRPLEERLREAAGSDIVRLLFFDEEHRVPEKYEFDKNWSQSFRGWAFNQSVKDLRWMLGEAGLEDVPKGPKSELVKLICHSFMPLYVDDCMLEILPYGARRVDHLRHLVEAGGHREVARSEVYEGDKWAVSNFPVILLFDEGDVLVEQVPREVLELLQRVTDEQWDDYRGMADTCAAFIRYVRCVVDLCGISDFGEIVERFGERTGHDLDPLVLEAFVRKVYQGVELGFTILNDEGNEVSYALSVAFVGAMSAMPRAKDGIDEDYINNMLESQATVEEPCPVRQEHLDAETIDLSVMKTPEAARLIEILDGYVPAGSQEWFSLEVTALLIYFLRDMENDEMIDEVLAKFDLAATGDLARDLMESSVELNRVIPKWHLRGWTLAELDERAGRKKPRFEVENEPAVWNLAPGFISIAEGKETLKELLRMSGDGAKRRTYSQEGLFLDLELNASCDFHAHYLFEMDMEAKGKELDDDFYANIDFEALIEENETYLDEFEKDLTESGLREATIYRHVNNVAFFLNNYVANNEGLSMRYGAYLARPFLGSFFIRKALWSTPATIRQTAAGMKKFYRCMLKLGHIEKADYDELLSDIKSSLDECCELCDRYNHPYG